MLAGPRRQFHGHRRYRLTKMPAQRAIVVGISRDWAFRFVCQPDIVMTVMATRFHDDCIFRAVRLAMLVSMSPAAHAKVSRLQGDRQQGDAELVTATHEIARGEN